jgi:flavin reductase (DIM6/NTAB) family NADH-FMN oxidoreductase RutF
MEPVPAHAIDHGDLILIPVRVVDIDISDDCQVRIVYQAVDDDGDNLRGSIQADHATPYMVADPHNEPDAYLFRLATDAF